MTGADVQSPEAEPTQSLFTRGYLVPFALVTTLFFLWGVPNNLNDVLIRQFMKSFAITRLQAGLVQSAFYMGYFLLALPSALYMRRLGYKAGFITGLLLFGAGTFLFWPAALVGQYWFFLLALFVMASGLSFLETASSTFIALARFLCCDRSFWHCTTMPVGKCVMRIAESVRLTCWPPAPDARNVSTRKSSVRISILISSSICG